MPSVKNKSPTTNINIIHLMNPEIKSKNIFLGITNHLAKIAKIDKDTLNNLWLITTEHYENIIKDFKNKIISDKNVNEADVKKLIHNFLSNHVHLKSYPSYPKIQKTIQNGGNKTMIRFADIIVSIFSLYFLFSTLCWVLVFIIKSSIMESIPTEYSNNKEHEFLRENSFISISLRIVITRFLYLFLDHIRNKLSNMLNKKGGSIEVDSNNEYTNYLNQVIEYIDEYKKNLNEEIQILSLGEIKTLYNVLQYRETHAIGSVYYTQKQFTSELLNEFRKAYEIVKPVTPLRISTRGGPISTRGGTKKRVKKNRRNTKKSSTK